MSLPLIETLEDRRLLAGFGVGGPVGGPATTPKVEFSLSVESATPVINEEGTVEEREVTFYVDRGEIFIDRAFTFGVQVVTADHVTDVNRRAEQGKDYSLPSNMTITLDAGQQRDEFTVLVKDDAVAEPVNYNGTGSKTEQFALALVPSQHDDYDVVDTPALVTIQDGTREYYSDWKKRLGPDSLTTGNTAVATSDPVILSSGNGGGAVGGGPPTSFTKTVEHLRYYDVWSVVTAQTSGSWMSDADGDGKDDNDVSLDVANYRGTDNSFTFGLGVDQEPLEVTLFEYTYSNSNTTAVGQTFEAAAADNQKVRLVVLAKTRHYEKRVDVYSQKYNGTMRGYDPDGWGQPTITFEALGTGSKFPEMQKAVFEINRYWLDPDDALVPSLFTQSKDGEDPEDKFWT